MHDRPAPQIRSRIIAEAPIAEPLQFPRFTLSLKREGVTNVEQVRRQTKPRVSLKVEGPLMSTSWIGQNYISRSRHLSRR
jgi:hypothetical protein